MRITIHNLILIFLLVAYFSLFPSLIYASNTLHESYFIEFITSNPCKFNCAEQVIFVVVPNSSSINAAVYVFEKQKEKWVQIYNSLKATVGRKGIAPIGRKIEGDGRTPSGAFDVGIAFGYKSVEDTKMTYKQITENDFWINDVDSKDYNKWVSGKPPKGSYEVMKRKDGAYRNGFVVEYNTNHIVKAKGSAIFFHVHHA